MIRLFLLLFTFAGLLFSCSRDLGIELPHEGNRLVIMAVLSADDSVKVLMDHTYPPTGEQLFDEGVTNARVLLYENDRLLDTLQRITKNRYAAKGTIRPVIGKAYRVRVEAPGYPPVESQPETIPPFPDLKTAVIEKKGGEYEVTVAIQDAPAVINQYELRLVSYYKEWETAINLRNLLRPDDVSDNCSFRGNLNTFYYRDICFENGLLTTRYGSSLRGTPQGRPPIPPDSLFIKGNEANPVADRAIVRLRTVNESYLNYYRYSPFADISQAFVIPTSRYSNVVGGYGIVLSYAERVVVLAVP
ncbi:DUF4249 domain-containing protein [Fibrella forsythiae]|uniref:DUF4249 domain-containing protein n=1 Tax=Fibrella forsythiae TaxID=2817061 RepID=A0ABS3JF54_9BACT|nr:DUF4249 domain-containing protein [Fibrella forsythiae]MBO0948623.1 DUF4249 domain-containing protein [Fibrella forsythiae]